MILKFENITSNLRLENFFKNKTWNSNNPHNPPNDYENLETNKDIQKGQGIFQSFHLKYRDDTIWIFYLSESCSIFSLSNPIQDVHYLL